MLKRSLTCIIFIVTVANVLHAQDHNSKLGAWYMYFWDTQLKNSQLGFQGDIQYRSWNFIDDPEQLLIRTGLTYRPKNVEIKFTLGYAYILSGEEGKENNETSHENRIYQEAIFPNKLGNRYYINHRFRFEQRFVEDQDFRTRFRYNLMMNVPLNSVNLNKGTYYIAFYNELFVNGQKDIGNGNTVELFDRNRLYLGIGFAVQDNLKFQFGFMNQTSDSSSKNQWQFGVHHVF